MKTVEWTSRQVMQADQALTVFLAGDRSGAVAYKAVRLKQALAETVQSIRYMAQVLIRKYQRVVDGVPVPTQFEGQPLPAEAWTTDATAYATEEAEMLAVMQSVDLPVLFMYEEIEEERAQGTVFVALFDCIESPKEVAI